MTKLKFWNKMWQNLNCAITKEVDLWKLKNSNCDKTQKLKLWQILKYDKCQFMKKNPLKWSFSKSIFHFDNRWNVLWAAFCDSCYVLFICITVKIACMTLLLKIFIDNLNVFLIQKHAFHSLNTAAFTVTVFTNHFVLFLMFSVLTGFHESHFLNIFLKLIKKISIFTNILISSHWINHKAFYRTTGTFFYQS